MHGDGRHLVATLDAVERAIVAEGDTRHKL
jgi:hypothetical protein